MRKNCTGLLLQIKEADIKASSEISLGEISAFKNSLPVKAQSHLDETFTAYHTDYRKAGTIERSSKKFNSGKLEQKHRKLNEIYLLSSRRWSNTHCVLFEDWRLDEELYILKCSLIGYFNETKQELYHKLNNILIPHVKAISHFLQSVEKNILGFSGSRNELKGSLINERRNTLRELRRDRVPKAIESLLEQQLSTTINTIELNLKQQVEKVSNKRGLAKNNQYTIELKSSDIDYISPRELISFESLPNFQDVTRQLKSKIVQGLEQVQLEIAELDRISDFNLESAVAILENEEKEIEDGKTIAAEGLKRAINKCQDIENDFLEIYNTVTDGLGKAVDQFNTDLIKFSKNENLFDINLRIAKAKALQRGKEYRARAISHARNIIPQVVRRSRTTLNLTTEYYKNFKKQYGLAKQDIPISAEISDFLAEVQSAVARLPYVYQRLFSIAPLQDRSFYEERSHEVSNLLKAYDNWDRSGFAPSVIVGEKGAGATTLLNFFVKDLNTKYKIIRFPKLETAYHEEELIAYFKSAFQYDDLNTIDDIIHYIGELPAKQIIIIENIQQLYLKKVNGFVCLKMLFRLMSKTNNKIFWLTSCTLYAWHYLDKTLTIEDYFGYIIPVQTLQDEQIINIILKRHRVSGYNITYEASALDRMSKKYRRLPATKKQEYLQQQFFSSLNKFAQSNLSMALIFWLRSTEKVSGDTITIGSMKGLDFSFLSSLSTSKLIVLHAVLLHDTLSEEHVSIILNLPLEQSRLLVLLMFDDGILVKTNGEFTINPLLYRQIVNLLQAKNFLY